MSDSAIKADRLFDLAGAICDESASEGEFAEMDTCLLADQRSRDRYLGYCWMHVALTMESQIQQTVQKVHHQINIGSVIPTIPAASPFDIATKDETSASPPPTFLSAAYDDTVAFLSSGWPVAYLVATVIFGVGLVVGSLVHLSQPAQVARQSSVPSRVVAEPKMVVVGRITGMVDCRWERKGLGIRDWGLGKESGAENLQSLIPNPQSLVALGDRFALASGLMEITYDTGAKVILQGPVTYEVESNGGYLAVGKLTGKLERKVASGQWSVVSKSNIQHPTSNISNPQSLIPNPSSLSTIHYPLFTIKTPTASVTDLGTEFGVEVSRSGETASHVFRGSIRVQVAAAAGATQGAAQVLHEGQSAMVGRGGGQPAMIVASSTSLAKFIREIPKRTIKMFDLVDVVAGGDGFSGRRGRGIDPTDGRPTDTTRKDMNLKDYGPIVGDGKYHRVEGLPLVDGVFIPNGRSGAVQVDSAGHSFAEFGQTDGMTGLNIWAGGTIPVPSSSMPSSVSSLLDSLSPSTTLGRTKLGGIDYATPGRGLIFLHANSGITFDLEAIRRANPGVKLLRFRAMAGNVEPVSQTGGLAGLADLWVLVDGQVRFRRREINGCSGAFPILFPVAENDRFLTLAASDGGKATGMAGDWVLFGDPVLETLPVTAANQADFVRERPMRTTKTLDLVDVVAGGDGFSGRRCGGIDPTTGRATNTPPKIREARFASDHKYHRVESLPFVDGVFIPNGEANDVQVDSAGHKFGVRPTDNTTSGYIWAGGVIPMDNPYPRLTELDGIDYSSPRHGVLFVHANKGITFDLDAIRKGNPGYKVLQFRAVAGNAETQSENGINVSADIWVLVDGQARFRRREINRYNGAAPIAIPIRANDRFLTLVATDGGNFIACDQIIFGDPRLELTGPEGPGNDTK